MNVCEYRRTLNEKGERVRGRHMGIPLIGLNEGWIEKDKRNE